MDERVNRTVVAVFGGGPAGLAAALALRQRGCRVALYDAQRPPIETIQAFEKEYKNLDLLLQGTQRENERAICRE